MIEGIVPNVDLVKVEAAGDALVGTLVKHSMKLEAHIAELEMTIDLLDHEIEAQYAKQEALEAALQEYEAEEEPLSIIDALSDIRDIMDGQEDDAIDMMLGVLVQHYGAE